MKRHSKLKGTVLFTVISVMSLLIIFLTSTLVLATSASNRSHKNYSASQAEYTARAAIDSFSQAMVRNVAIAQSVVNLNSSNPTLNPTVEIVSSDMGKVGYYDEDGNLEENKIRVEYVGDTYVYSENKWVAQQVLKITATAVVGGEESTVTAYMRKKAPDEPKPLSIKGFQTLGGGGYTTTSGYISGAISMGITDEPANRTYDLSNASEYNTDMFFVNGNLNVSGNDIRIDATKTNSASIIMGDLVMQNSFLIDVNYPYATRENANAGTPWKYELTQKDIPYIYVDGSIKPGTATNPFKVQTTGIDTATAKATNSPYNVFCGHFDPDNSSNGVSVEGDIYIMGNESGAKGTSYFGRKNQNMTELYAWTNSVLNRTETQFYSNGGNLYSRDNLQVENAHIKGDVRVDGDFMLGDGVIIEGDLVVSGRIRKTDGTEFNFSLPEDKNILVNAVEGNIYNGTSAVSIEGLGDSYHAHNNTYNEANNVKPGYVRVQNFEYPNFVKNNAVYESIAIPNIQYANYVDDVQAVGIERDENQRYNEPDFKMIQYFQTEWWPEPKFSDNEGHTYSADDTIRYIDVNGNEVEKSIMDIDSYQWGRKTLYSAGGKLYGFEPYVESRTGAITSKQYSYYLIKTDGSYVSTPDGHITIYQADINGNKSDIPTDSFSVIYKSDMYGNPINETTTEEYTYYKPDKDGNITPEETSEKIFIYRVDENDNITDDIVSEYVTYYEPDENGNITGNVTTERSFRFKADRYGNPTNQIAYDFYTYYNEAGSEVSESEAISTTAFYTKWYSPYETTSDEVSYYDVDPDAPPAEASPVNDAEGNYTPQYQNWIRSHEVPLSSVTITTNILKYDDYSGGAYPASMTREAIRGESEGGKYKIVSTLEDIKESIGCSSTNTFDENTYYKEVPNANIVGGRYVDFDYVRVSGNHNYNIRKNTVITTGETSNGPVVININPSGNTLWIVLDNCNFGNGKHRIVVSGNGIVNFLIKDTLNFDGNSPAGIFTKNVWDQIEAGGKIIIREDDKLNINYYGTEGSHFNIGNQTVLCGIARCPYSTINIGSQGCQKDFTYIDKNGKVIEFNGSNPIEARKKGANWIGNALFKEMGSSANNFRLLYTGSSDDASNDIVNATLDTTWTVMYYDTY